MPKGPRGWIVQCGWLVGLAGAAAGVAWGLQLPDTVYTSELDASFVGEAAGDAAGGSIASVGDINGDGLSDLVIGAGKADAAVGQDAGKIYIIFGREGSQEDSWATQVNLSEADVVLTGEAAKDELGAAVSALGDVNNDGYNDFAVGAPVNAGNGSSSGKVYIVLGKSSGWTSSSAINSVAVASFVGNQYESAGTALSAAGDVNGDNCDDILIGVDAYTYKVSDSEYYNFAGRALLVFGRAATCGNTAAWAINVKLDSGADASIVGEITNEFVGRAVAGGGDLNGDGLDDIVIGAPGHVATDASSSTERGQIGIVWGKYSGWSLGQMFSSADVIYTGEFEYDEAGKTLALLQDVSNDGLSDLVVGAPSYSPATDAREAGKVYLILGRTGGWSAENTFAEAEANWIGEHYYDRAGSSLAAAGDLNQDGYRDFVVGAPLSDEYVEDGGKTYVVFGGPDLPAQGLLADADIQLVGSEFSSQTGKGLAGAFSLDGDYHGDLAIGAPKADLDPDTTADAGVVYILRGALFQDIDQDGYSEYLGDCDDGDPGVSPSAVEIAYDGIDQDCDGADLTDVDGDGIDSPQVAGGTDCDDSDSAIYPGAAEICDAQDDDCDGSTDEGVQSTFYIDADGDGHGSSGTSIDACSAPDGYAANTDDCDDSDSTVYPGAAEVAYDDIDQNCNGGDLTDVDQDGQDAEKVGGTDCDDYNADVYLGGEESPYNGIDEDCSGADLWDVDADGFDWEGRGGADCDDEDAGINPDAEEVPYDGIDQDCDGADLADVDGDGSPYVGDGTVDCDDLDATVYPGADDLPDDGVDQNCDGVQASDADDDLYPVDGDPAAADFDCDDSQASIHPGAEEVPDDGIDQDCDGLDWADVDGDGFSAGDEPVDCDDEDATIYPGAGEVAYDGIDQDCDGDDLSDVDGDGYDGGESGEDCDDGDSDVNPGSDELPANDEDENCDGLLGDEDGDGYDAEGEPADCNDRNPAAYPGAEEVPYDGVDQDCTGADVTDVDEDGFLGETAGGLDCDDEDPDVNPAATEVPGDGLDNDCDGSVDPEDLDGDGYSVAQGDCDDEDPDVNPAATEVSGDGIDNDCDGLLVPEDVDVLTDPALGCACRQGEPAASSGWSSLVLLTLAVAGTRRRGRGRALSALACLGGLELLAPGRSLGVETTLQVVDLLPGTADRAAAVTRLSRQVAAPVILLEPDELIEHLRWAVEEPSRLACREKADALLEQVTKRELVSEPADPGELATVLLDQAAKQILYLDLVGALESLEAARAQLPCLSHIVSQAQVRAIFLHEAVARVYLNDPAARVVFLDMLAVDPRIYLEPDYPPLVRNAFLEAAQELTLRPLVPLDPTELEGRVFVDGQPITTVRDVRPGRHILQRRGPHGEVRTALVTVAPESRPIPLRDLAPFELPDPARVRQMLDRALAVNRLDPTQLEGIGRYAAALGIRTLGFALEAPDQSGPLLKVFRTDRGLLDVSSASAVSSPAVPSRAAKAKLGIDAEVRSGVGAAWIGQLSPTVGATLDLEISKRLGSRWRVGVFGSLRYDWAWGGAYSPGLNFGLETSLRLPLGQRWSLQPAAGYGGGKGPPARVACAVVLEEGVEQVYCDAAGTDLPIQGLLRTDGHGPMGRVELVYEASSRLGTWTARMGARGHYLLLRSSSGEGRLGDGSGTSLPYTVADGLLSSAVRVDLLAGLGLAF